MALDQRFGVVLETRDGGEAARSTFRNKDLDSALRACGWDGGSFANDCHDVGFIGERGAELMGNEGSCLRSKPVLERGLK